MPTLLEIALSLHQANRLAEAESHYRQALAGDAKSAEAEHFLGMLLCQTNRQAQGLQLMHSAVTRAPVASLATEASPLAAVVTALGYQNAVAVLMVMGRYTTHAIIVNALAIASPVPSIFARE